MMGLRGRGSGDAYALYSPGMMQVQHIATPPLQRIGVMRPSSPFSMAVTRTLRTSGEVGLKTSCMAVSVECGPGGVEPSMSATAAAASPCRRRGAAYSPAGTSVEAFGVGGGSEVAGG